VAVVDRGEALRRLRDGQARFDRLLAGVAGKELTHPGTIGNGDWSAKDLIGHIATWEGLALASIRDFGAGRTPWPERKAGVFSAPATGKIAAFNERTIKARCREPLSKVKADARRTHRQLLAAIESLSDVDWKAKAFYPTPNNRRRTLAALLGSLLAGEGGAFRHNNSHVSDLRAFVRSASR
jgi:hypothetical protein